MFSSAFYSFCFSSVSRRPPCAARGERLLGSCESMWEGAVGTTDRPSCRQSGQARGDARNLFGSGGPEAGPTADDGAQLAALAGERGKQGIHCRGSRGILIGKVCKTGPNSSQAIKSIDCVLNAVYYILVILFIYLQCCYKLKDPFLLGVPTQINIISDAVIAFFNALQISLTCT